MKTLKLSLPFGRIFLQALLSLVLFSLTLELFSRTPLIDRLTLPQSYGSSHPHFEAQISRLKERIAQGEPSDCIFIGNSQVLYGVDPVIVEERVYQQTGQVIHCQNFGLGGLPPMSAAPLAKVLIKNFHPSIIIFGTGMWDYSSSNAFSTHNSLMSSPWMQYQLGSFSLDGWFYDQSLAFRYIFGADRALKTRDDKGDRINADGHATYSGQTQLTIPEQLEYFETIAERPEITPTQLDGLKQLLALNSSEVRIIVIETPFDPTFLTVKRKARLLYPDFKKMLTYQAEAAGVDLWLTQDSITFPQEDWYDLIHLNEQGSIYFSGLLGDYLAGVLAAQGQ